MPILLPSRRPKDDAPKYTGDPEEYRLTLIEHLEELRTRLIRSVCAIGVGWVIGWYGWKPIYGYLGGVIDRASKEGLGKDHAYFQNFHSAPDAFFLQLKLSFLIGGILAVPFVVLQIWAFVAPALKPNEQKPFRKLAPFSVLLFLLGAAFAWFVTPNAIRWFTGYLDNFPGTALFQEAGQMVFFVLKMLLAFGLSFQLPLIVYGLGLAGLLSAEALIKYWRQSVVVIFVVAAVFTPSNDPLTMGMMAIPMCVLFMISVYAVKLVQRKRPKTGSEQ